MPTNFPGPYELRFNYTTTIGTRVRSHQFRHSLDLLTDIGPGDIFANYDGKTKAGGSSPLSSYAPTIEGLLDDIFHTSSSFGTVELWKYTAGTFDASFYSEYTLGTNGVSVNNTVEDSEIIITFRSENGGIARVQLEETHFSRGKSQVFDTSDADINALANFLVGGSSMMVARDNGYLFAPLKYHPGENEHYFKKTNRA